MKKITLLISFLSTIVLQAQEKLVFQDLNDLRAVQNDLQFPIDSTHQYANYVNLIGGNINNKEEVTNTLTNKRWGQFRNIDDDQLQTFELNYTFGNDANISLKLLNDDLSIKKEINLPIPATTNDVQLITNGTKNLGKNDGKLKFAVYAHYFEGGMGPNFQKNRIYVVNEDGEKLEELDANFFFFIKNEDGSTGVLTAFDDKTGTLYRLYDDQFNLKKDFFIEKNKSNNYAGNPLSFVKIDGKDKLVFSHYEKQFMNNATMEVTPDNHLLVKIADLNLNFEKEIKLNLTSKFPEDKMVFALGNFGTLPFGNQYAISSKNFNSDDKLEIIYALSYRDMVNDKTWSNYMVASEDGTIIKEINKDVIALKGLSPIAGEKDQLGFIVGNDNVISSIDMMNISTMEEAISFPVEFNNLLLTTNFDRFANNGTYSYMLGTNNGIKDAETNKSYGIVNQVSKTGVLEKETNLFIGYDPVGFAVMLNSETLNPKVYNNDEDMEFSYVYFQKQPEGTKYFNTFNVSKGGDEVMFTKDGLGALGDVKSSSFLRNNDNTKFTKLGVVHQIGNNPIITTEFYDLPFTSLKTAEVDNNTIKVYIDKINNTLNWGERVEAYQVYSITGNLIRRGYFADKVSLNNFTKGVYIINFKHAKGNKSTKFIVK